MLALFGVLITIGLYAWDSATTVAAHIGEQISPAANSPLPGRMNLPQLSAGGDDSGGTFAVKSTTRSGCGNLPVGLSARPSMQGSRQVAAGAGVANTAPRANQSAVNDAHLPIGRSQPNGSMRQFAAAVASGGELAEVFALLQLAATSTGEKCVAQKDQTEYGQKALRILQEYPALHPLLPNSVDGELQWPDSAMAGTVQQNLRAISYRDGVMTLWTKTPSALAAAFTTRDLPSGSLAGWSHDLWNFTVLGDRIEIRETRR
jgi:hypothetical protein